MLYTKLCTNCHDTGLDPALPHAPCTCPVGLDFRAELAREEPCYGHCQGCERSGELWSLDGGWLCYYCLEREARR